MAIKAKRRLSIRIDMTPMVDIAFLLLIFYMATTQFKPPEAKAVELPGSHSMIELPDRDMINVTITALDSIFVDWVETRAVEIDDSDVETPVRIVRKADVFTVSSHINRARVETRKKGRSALVVIKADREASFGTIRDVMTSMQSSKLERFLIVTEHEVEADGRRVAAHFSR